MAPSGRRDAPGSFPVCSYTFDPIARSAGRPEKIAKRDTRIVLRSSTEKPCCRKGRSGSVSVARKNRSRIFHFARQECSVDCRDFAPGVFRLSISGMGFGVLSGQGRAILRWIARNPGGITKEENRGSSLFCFRGSPFGYLLAETLHCSAGDSSGSSVQIRHSSPGRGDVAGCKVRGSSERILHKRLYLSTSRHFGLRRSSPVAVFRRHGPVFGSLPPRQGQSVVRKTRKCVFSWCIDISSVCMKILCVAEIFPSRHSPPPIRPPFHESRRQRSGPMNPPDASRTKSICFDRPMKRVLSVSFGGVFPSSLRGLEAISAHALWSPKTDVRKWQTETSVH